MSVLPVSCSTCVELISTVGLKMPVTSQDMLKNTLQKAQQHSMYDFPRPCLKI